MLYTFWNSITLSVKLGHATLYLKILMPTLCPLICKKEAYKEARYKRLR